jgi:hypothetical protein
VEGTTLSWAPPVRVEHIPRAATRPKHRRRSSVVACRVRKTSGPEQRVNRRPVGGAAG